MYIVDEKIYFVEITFNSSSGIEEIEPKKFEKKLSSFLKLPKIAYNIDRGEYYRLIRPFSFYLYYFIFAILIIKLLCIIEKLYRNNIYLRIK